MNKYVYIVSLGCAKNLVDTELAAGSLAVNSIGFADSPENADVYFINTCAFISPARDEAEQFIKEAVKWKQTSSGRKIIVAGCLTQWDKDEKFRTKYPSIDLWLPVDEATNLNIHVNSLFEGSVPGKINVETPTYIYDESSPRLQLTPAHYAYLKIADGCDNNCTYCSIPAIRGHLRNRTIKSICSEAKNLISNGVKELILAAQDTTAYSDPETGEALEVLISELDKLGGEFGIRLLYAHPAHLTDEVIAKFADSEHLLPYIDLPLQHISDPILKRMNRKVTACEIRRKIDKLRNANPDIAIRTTFLVGYPGETESDFQEICKFIREIKFTRLGVFPYCPEERTPAAKFANHVPAEIAQERCDEIMQMQSEISLEMNKKLIGKEMKVIIDDVFPDEQYAVGRTYMDAPEIDNTVEIEIGDVELEPGAFINVKIEDASEFQLFAAI